MSTTYSSAGSVTNMSTANMNLLLDLVQGFGAGKLESVATRSVSPTEWLVVYSVKELTQAQMTSLRTEVNKATIDNILNFSHRKVVVEP